MLGELSVLEILRPSYVDSMSTITLLLRTVREVILELRAVQQNSQQAC